jgi:hypothetical protein
MARRKEGLVPEGKKAYHTLERNDTVTGGFDDKGKTARAPGHHEAHNEF